jgi:pyruvate kinase
VEPQLKAETICEGRVARRQRNTKIIATLGAATSTPDQIRSLFDAGVDVFRLCMGRGTHADHLARYEAVRAIEKQRERPIGVLLDLQGPKLRIGRFRHAQVELAVGQSFVLDRSEALGDHDRVSLPHPGIFAAAGAGDALFVDDGRVRLRVQSVTNDTMVTRVETGGTICDYRSVHVPGVRLSMPVLTDKDMADLEFGLLIGVDWIALSFVQHADDIHVLRRHIGGRSAAKIIAKLEKPSALKYLEQIVSAADAIMIARGDMGVELPPEEVPIEQRRIVRECRRQGKPVVIATQMMASMVQQPAPTRAEVNDVATAVYSGADAIMLSAETASGRYPVEAVEIMDRIVRRIESDVSYDPILRVPSSMPSGTCSADAIGAAIRTTAEVLPITATAAYTSSGATCLAVARERPRSPILGLSPSLETVRMLSLVWGVHSIQMNDVKSVEEMVASAAGVARRHGYTEDGKPFVIVAGIPFGTPGSTNMLQIAWA